MKAKAHLKGTLTGLGSGGFISVLNKTYEITYAQNPVSKHVLVEVEVITGMTGSEPEYAAVTGIRSIIHDNWTEFHRSWNVVEELDASVQPEGY